MSKPRPVCLSKLYRSFSASARCDTSAIQQWIHQVTSAPPVLAYDEIDPRRAEQLYNTLPRSNLSLPKEGDHLPKGWHLIYFQPKGRIEDLGDDGTSTDTNPPPPYLRRMWAGGSFTYPSSRSIKIGSRLVESTRIGKVEEKAGMLFTYEEKELKEIGTDDVLLKEIRTRVFRPLAEERSGPRVVKPKSPYTPPASQFSLSLTPTSPLLFRFSALTFNAHKIHYDLPFTQSHEGHPSIVFHGPLSALLLTQLVEQHLTPGKRLQTFEYRATGPMYVGKGKVWLEGRIAEDGERVEVWARQGDTLGMRATAGLT